MRKLSFVVIILLITAVAGGLLVLVVGKKAIIPQTTVKEIIAMKISSPAFENNKRLPTKYTCDGENINPPLVISDVPTSAKSLALIVDDPDAPAGTWVHWLIWNMDPALVEIGEGVVPEGVEGLTSYRQKGYNGPCPPSGIHRYFFKLYALDTILAIPETSDKAALEKAMQDHIVAYAELVGWYSRK